MSTQLIEQLREEIRLRLQRKTGWGRNEILTEIDSAIFKVLLNSDALKQDIENKSKYRHIVSPK